MHQRNNWNVEWIHAVFSGDFLSTFKDVKISGAVFCDIIERRNLSVLYE